MFYHILHNCGQFSKKASGTLQHVIHFGKYNITQIELFLVNNVFHVLKTKAKLFDITFWIQWQCKHTMWPSPKAFHQSVNDQPHIAFPSMISLVFTESQVRVHCILTRQHNERKTLHWEIRMWNVLPILYVRWFIQGFTCLWEGRQYVGKFLFQFFHLPTPCPSTHPDVIAGNMKWKLQNHDMDTSVSY